MNGYGTILLSLSETFLYLIILSNMKVPYLLLLGCVLAACHSNLNKANNNIAKKTKTLISYLPNKSNNRSKADTNTSATENAQVDDYADYYVVIADTGLNYTSLRDEMLNLQRVSNVPIDTMDRTYNKAKNLIALPDNYEDEMYAGDYYPRRTPSKTLSLEYLNMYKDDAKGKIIALVAGIFESSNSADSALSNIKLPGSFKLKAHIYQGCLH